MTNRVHLLALTALVAGCAVQPRAAGPAPTATATAPAQARPAVDATGTLFFLDGAEVRAADVGMIKSDLIATIDHFTGPAAEVRYGPRARAGVIQIVTKAPRSTPTTVLYLLDGREIPAELVRAIDDTRVNSIEVVTGAAAHVYNNPAHGSVVLIKSKKS